MKRNVAVFFLCLVILIGLTYGCEQSEPDAIDPPVTEDQPESISEPEDTVEPALPEDLPEETTDPEIVEEEEEEPENEEEPPEIDYSKYLRLYAEVLDDFYEFLSLDYMWPQAEKAEIGMLDRIYGKDPEEAKELIGFALKDISGDDIPELIIAPTDIDQPVDFLRGRIYGIYTLVDDAPVFTTMGTDFHSTFYIRPGVLYYQGISGATGEIFRFEIITLDGTTTIPEQRHLVKTIDPAATDSKWKYYWSQLPNADEPAVEDEELTEEDFNQLVLELSN